MRVKLLVPATLVAAAATLALAPTANAATTIERNIPFDAVVAGCTEDIQVTGSLMAVFGETTTPSGGFQLTTLFKPVRTTGVGLTSGKTFIATGLTRETTIFGPAGGFTDTFVNQFHIVGTAGAQTYDVREIAHITVTASGNVTVALDHFTSTC